MKLVVGLGNPGAEYETTRHNAGFLALDRLIDELKAHGPKTQEKAELFQATFQGERVLLAKPQTFMNRSGDSVIPLLHFYKIDVKDLIVIYDDLDLPFPSMRIRVGGGTGGHNGLKSLEQRLGVGNTDYTRVRLGIGRPTHEMHGAKRSQVVNHVLEPFTDEELPILDKELDRVTQATFLLLQDKALDAMNQFNRKEGD